VDFLAGEIWAAPIGSVPFLQTTTSRVFPQAGEEHLLAARSVIETWAAITSAVP